MPQWFDKINKIVHSCLKTLYLCPGQFQKRSSPPPSPGHLTFLKMLDQIPRYMGRFQGQMPHWLGLKSQKFHNLSGIVERIAKEIFGSQSTEQGLKSPDKNYASMNPMDPKSLRTCAGDFI